MGVGNVLEHWFLLPADFDYKWAARMKSAADRFFSFLFYLKQYEVYINLLHISILLSALFLILLAFTRTENKSFGSLDNASSVGILLELAKILKNNPPKNIDICLLFTGAEEEGLIGASAFIQKHFFELDSKKDLFLNLDSPANKRLMVSFSKKKPKDDMEKIAKWYEY